ncbi:MAG TPA: hypothetical protein VMW27_05845 [Thermoanaerobaculia bacterium]|nr:hypothetical protein [Thermoanaerobaculia bacterium]
MPRPGRSGKGEGPPEAPSRPGLPAPESVVSEKTFTSPKGKRYRILRTDETDPYDKPTETESDCDER